MRRVSQLLNILLLVLLAAACAKQNTSGPQGGPVDEDPPVVVKAVPPNQSTNFTGKTFSITFDEYFVLDNINQKLMVSPPLGVKPEVKVKNKTMVVSFDEELRDSVTYTFYFMDAVRDLNENNPIENFQYVFSTGPSIDSLSVTGTVYDAQSLDPAEEIFITLYSNLSDTSFSTILPDYITRAKPDGSFRIDNMAPGEYNIFGLHDLNNNKIFDLPDETIAFTDSAITVTPVNNYIGPMPDTLTSAADSARYLTIPGREYRLFLFTQENSRQYLTGTKRDDPYKLQLTFRQPVDSGQFSLSFIDTLEVRHLIEHSAGRDTIIVWLLDSAVYSRPRISIAAMIPESDSAGGISLRPDTLDFRYTAPRTQRGRAPAKTPGLLVKDNSGGRSGFKPGRTLAFRFETPLHDPDTSKFEVLMVYDTLLLPVKHRLLRDTTSSKRLYVEGNFRSDSSYMVRYNRGAFTDIFGKSNDSTVIRFKVRNAESFGTLTINLSGYRGNLIVQLLETSGKLVKEDIINIDGSVQVYYPLLEKGEYQLKAIFDLDGDGKWTTGNYELKQQPEPVTFFPTMLEIKVQWDLVQDWLLSGINFKPETMRKIKTEPSR